MYLFTICDAFEPIPGVNYPMDARHTVVAKGVARSQIKRFKHENYVRTFNNRALTNVINRRIGSKLHQVRLIIFNCICMTAHQTLYFQMYTMNQVKRGLCPYDDKRYLLADLLNWRPNPHTHSYDHHDLTTEETMVGNQPEPGAELIIRYREKRFTRQHARVTRRLEHAGVMDMAKELPDGNANGELLGDQLLMAERVAVAQPSGAISMNEVIERIIARDNL